MSLLNDYVRVTADCPCPKCGKPDWCLIHRKGNKCVCSRVPSGMAYGEAGWVHYLPPGTATPAYVSRKKKVYLPIEEVQDFVKRTSVPPNDELLGKLSQVLRLSPRSVWTMQAGYYAPHAVLSFPMFNGQLRPTGCRFRRRDGKKWSLKGGREGVFLSLNLTPNRPVWISEGPTDAAALIEAGIQNVLGRPNCSGGVAIIRQLMEQHPRTPIIVLSDPDEPGIAGAERLVLSLPNPAIVLSGVKDIRTFVTSFPQRLDARDAILEVLAGYGQGQWQEIARNRAGHCFNFSQVRNHNGKS